MQTIRYQSSKKTSFEKELYKRVREYMKSDKVKNFDVESYMLKKAIFLVCVYFSLNILLYFVHLPVAWWAIVLVVLLGIVSGFAKSVIGTIMHEGNHGSISRNQRLNDFFGRLLRLAGGYRDNWIMQHNFIHHTDTNVHGHDDDIDGHDLLRFSPHQEHKSIHRAQVILAPLLYGFMTLLWVTTKDFSQIIRYNKRYNEGRGNPLYKDYANSTLFGHFVRATLIKLAYWSIFFILPALFWNGPWWFALIYFFSMHYTAGLYLGLVFQPAHVSTKTVFEENLEVRSSSRAEHQMRTSCNFATKNKFVSWGSGGLNFQIEHHLFPGYSYVFYEDISKIVKEVARKYGIPYNEHKTFRSAIIDHFKLLYELGKKPTLKKALN